MKPQGKAELPVRGTMAELIRDVVEIVAQLSRVDAALDEVRRAAPITSEAGKWHEMSITALTLSRDALVGKQNDLLQHLRDATCLEHSGPNGKDADKVQQAPLSEVQTEVHAREQLPAREPVQDPPSHPGEPMPEPNATQLHNSEPPQSLKDAKEQYGVRSLRKDLEALRLLPEKRVIIVRKIKALGFASVEALREYFEEFGPVEDVIVPHSSTKPGPRRGLGRMRPGVMGFVVMGNSEAAEAAMEKAEAHVVRDVAIKVSWFNHGGCAVSEHAGENHLACDA